MAPLSLKIILDGGAVTRTVMFESNTKVADADAIIKEKILTADDGKEYALFLTSADDPRSGIWLEAHRALDYYMLRDGDSLLYLNKQRNLRVRMLDGSVKTLQVDESKNVGDLMMVICGKIGISNYDEYGLCNEDKMDQEECKENRPATGTLTLKRKTQQRERDAKMDELSKKLKTDDNVDWLDQHKTLREVGVDFNETLLLKRRLFFSDRNIDSRDPVQLNLLYVQTRDAILNGRHPVTEAEAAECKKRWVHIRDVHRRLIKKCLKDPSPKYRPYKYEKELEFIKPFYKELFTSNLEIEFVEQNENEEDNFDDYNQPDEDATEEDAAESDESEKTLIKTRKLKKSKRSKTPRKRKVEEVEPEKHETFEDLAPTQLDPKDPVDAFLLSIGATLKTFAPYHLNLAKSQIFSVVQQHEMEQIVNEPTNEANEAKFSTSSNNDHRYIS